MKIYRSIGRLCLEVRSNAPKSQTVKSISIRSQGSAARGVLYAGIANGAGRSSDGDIFLIPYAWCVYNNPEI